MLEKAPEIFGEATEVESETNSLPQGVARITRYLRAVTFGDTAAPMRMTVFHRINRQACLYDVQPLAHKKTLRLNANPGGSDQGIASAQQPLKIRDLLPEVKRGTDGSDSVRGFPRSRPAASPGAAERRVARDRSAAKSDQSDSPRPGGQRGSRFPLPACHCRSRSIRNLIVNSPRQIHRDPHPASSETPRSNRGPVSSLIPALFMSV